jgi:hypothetical protein
MKPGHLEEDFESAGTERERISAQLEQARQRTARETKFCGECRRERCIAGIWYANISKCLVRCGDCARQRGVGALLSEGYARQEKA